jgi:glyoxylase-like metal-dependent hydrolase (beta-lactamase superfamily II)
MERESLPIHTLDLNFQGRASSIASYLVEGPGGPVLVETGPASTLPTLLAGLAERGYTPADVRHVLVTHIHLDHAGAAGWWAGQGAEVYVHHVGAPHLIDPSKLLASAGRIYGDQMEALWGQVLPAPAERVHAIGDGDCVEVAGLSFLALDTPGHAYHHHVYRLGEIAFTGDAAGIHIPGPAFVDLPAPPPEFNLGLWRATIARLLQGPFTAIYPTHFGRVDGWQAQLAGLAALLEEATEFIRRRMEEGLEREGILAQYLEWHFNRARAAGMPQEVLARYEAANPHYMSVDGIMRYWRKR